MMFKTHSQRTGWLSFIVMLTIFGTTFPLVVEALPVEDVEFENPYYYQDPGVDGFDVDGRTEAQGSCLFDCVATKRKSFWDNLKDVKDLATKAQIRLQYTFYSLHPKTLKMIKIGLSKGDYPRGDSRTGQPRVQGNCFAEIKNMLRDSGFITPYERSTWNEGMAKNAGPQLEKIGFINLFNPESPAPFNSCADGPIGAICVYAPIDPGAMACYSGRCYEAAGHIELNLDEHGFPAQYKGKSPYTGRDPQTGEYRLSNEKYQLIGIYVKPNPNDKYDF